MASTDIKAKEPPILKSVQVVACLNLFNEQQTIINVKAGSTIGGACAELGIADFKTARCFVNGEPVSKKSHRLKKNDSVTVRVVPASWAPTGAQSLAPTGKGKGAWGSAGGSPVAPAGGAGKGTWGLPSSQTALQFAGGALGLGSLLLMKFFGKSQPGEKANDIYSPIATTPEANEAVTYQDPVNTQPLLGLITGTSNRKNQYGRIPNAYGIGNKFFPPLASDIQSSIEGNTQYAVVAYELGYGELALSDLQISNRPIADFSATTEIHVGTTGETPFTFLTKDAEEQFVNLPLLRLVENTIETNQEGTRLGVDIQLDNGLYQNVIYTNPQGIQSPSRIAASVSVSVYYRPAGSSDPYELAGAVNINELQINAFRRPLYFTVPRGRYQLKVTRYDGGSSDPANTQDSVTLVKVQVLDDFTDAFHDLKDSTGAVLPTARIVMRIPQSDQQQGQIGEFSVKYDRLIRHWNGSTWDAPAASDNPADIFCDILQGKHNKFPAPDARLDLEKILIWWQYCHDKGLKFNKVFEEESSPLEALRQVCILGRARFCLADGKYSVTIDQEQTVVVQHFTPRNSWGFHWKSTNGKTADLLKVRFIDPLVNFQQNERFVFNDGYTLENYQDTESIDLAGCIDKDLAWVYGRLVLAANKARRRVYQWYADHEAIVCRQGDLIVVTNPLIGSGLGQGRITSLVTNGGGDITGLTIDARVPQELSKSYRVRIRQADGSSYSGAVNSLVEGRTKALTLTTPILAATAVKPVVGDLLMYGEDPESREMLVTNLEWAEDMTCQITAVDHAPGIYTADTGTIPAFTSYIQGYHPAQRTVAAPEIWNYQSDETVLERDIDGAYRTRVVLNMAPPAADVTYLEVQTKLTGSSAWSATQVQAVTGGPFSVYGLQDGLRYDFRIRARDTRNVVSSWNESLTNYFVVGMTTLPQDVPSIEIDIDGNARIYYDSAHGVAVAKDFAGFIWKYHQGHNTDWATATTLTQLTGATFFNFSRFARGLKTILVKAVDMAGNQSETAASIVIDYGDIIPANIVHTETFLPAVCTITDGNIVGDTIEAQDTSNMWSATPGSVRFYKGLLTDLFWGSSYGQLVVEFEYTPTAALLRKPFTVLPQVEVDAQTWRFEYRVFGNSHFWDGSPLGPSRPFYSGTGSSAFWTSVSEWLPVPETGLPGNYGKYQFRITCDPSKYRSIVSAPVLVLDAPDISERLYNVEIPTSAGLRLPITVDKFVEIQAVNVLGVIQDVSYPDAFAVEIVDYSLSGPLVKIKDATGAYTGGKISVEVAGI